VKFAADMVKERLIDFNPIADSAKHPPLVDGMGWFGVVQYIDAHRSRVQGLQGSPSGRLMGWRFAESAWIDDAA